MAHKTRLRDGSWLTAAFSSCFYIFLILQCLWKLSVFGHVKSILLWIAVSVYCIHHFSPHSYGKAHMSACLVPWRWVLLTSVILWVFFNDIRLSHFFFFSFLSISIFIGHHGSNLGPPQQQGLTTKQSRTEQAVMTMDNDRDDRDLLRLMKKKE